MDTEELTKAYSDLKAQFESHKHSGLDSSRVAGSDIASAPQGGLSTSTGTLGNAVQRIAEIENRLQNLGLIR